MPSNREFLESLQEKQRLIRENRPVYFTPNGKQHEFVNSDAFINIFSAANGVGKTTIAINIIVNIIYGPQNKWFNTPFYRQHRRPARVRIASDPVVIEEKIVPELQKWLPKNTYTSEKARRPYEAKWYINAGPGKGSMIDILTYNQEPKEFEAVELDVAWFDEPPPRSIFTPTVRGFRFGGIMYITMTPLKGAGFLFEQMEEISKIKQTTKRKRRNIIFASVESNCRQHGIRGILEHDNIEQMISEYDPEERKARIEGKPQYQEGAVYKKFGEVHVVPPHRIPDDATHYFAIDPHDAKPHAGVWAYVNKFGEVYIYREMLAKGTIGEAIKHMKEVEDNQIIFSRIMDAYFGKKPLSNTGRTVKQTFVDEAKKIGWNIGFRDGPAGQGAIEAGHQIVRSYMNYDANKPIDATNIPRLFVFESCPNVIKSYRNYRYVETTGRNADRHGQKEGVEEKFKDLMDCVRFIVQTNPKYVPRLDRQMPKTGYVVHQK
jgi:phage terminase large subunit-like protein